MKFNPSKYLHELRALFLNRFFWYGMIALLLAGFITYALFNNVIMPNYTRHNVAVQVPETRNLPFEDAILLLSNNQLQVEKVVQRYNPSLPQGIVVDQNPPPNSMVKPGRRVYLTVNSGELPQTDVPSLKNLSLRQARSLLQTSGLQVGEVQVDSIPSPYQDTVTRQSPEPGRSVPEGSRVDLWISPGLGQQYVMVPDVTGLTVEQAERSLTDYRLRFILLPAERDEDVLYRTIIRQSPEAGSSVREGFEVRIYMESEEDVEEVPEIDQLGF